MSDGAFPGRASRQILTARITGRPPRLGATILAFAVIFALAWVFFIRTSPQAPAPELQSAAGGYVWQAVAPGASGVPVETGSFAAVASGDAGGEMTSQNTAPRAGTSGSAQSAYVAARRTETTAESRTTPLGGGATQTRLVGAWPPVWRVATRSPLDYQGLAAVVRTAVEDRDDSVGIKPLKDGDRDVWRAAMTLDGEPIQLVVDQVSGLVTWYSDDRSTFTATVNWASPPPADRTFAVTMPAGADVKTVRDGGHAYEPSPAAAGRAAGYDPLVSGLAPDGYSLGAVATFAGDYQPLDWLGESGVGKPPPTGVDELGIALLYARGLSWFTVEELGPKTTWYFEGAVRDELKATATRELSYEAETVRFGSFEGMTAHTWYEKSGPTLYLSDGRWSVYVTGALTRQELISFAEGLKPVASDGSE